MLLLKIYKNEKKDENKLLRFIPLQIKRYKRILFEDKIRDTTTYIFFIKIIFFYIYTKKNHHMIGSQRNTSLLDLIMLPLYKNIPGLSLLKFDLKKQKKTSCK